MRALLRHCEANPRRGVRRGVRRGARRGAARRATCAQFAAALPSIDRIEAAARPLAHPASPASAASPDGGVRGVESNADGRPPGAGGEAELIAGGDGEGDEEEAEEGGEDGEEDEEEEEEEEEGGELQLDEEELQLLGAFFTGVKCAAASLPRPSAPLCAAFAPPPLQPLHPSCTLLHPPAPLHAPCAPAHDPTQAAI